MSENKARSCQGSRVIGLDCGVAVQCIHMNREPAVVASMRNGEVNKWCYVYAPGRRHWWWPK
jgi:hypothetical protein